MGHLAPSYGMDFDRDYSSYNLNNISTNSPGMNDISALAAAASDQLYELERHEAFRRAEFEMRHRQIASARKSNGNSPSATPASNERDKYGLNGISTPEGRVVYPVSAAQGASGNQPAVPSGTLADPTYLVPPTCCHEECHKSYRKRLKYAKATQACPNCLSQPGNGHHHNNGHGQGGNGGGSGHHSSGSNTPKDRTGGNSSEDLTKLGGSGGQGGSLGGGGGGNSNNCILNWRNFNNNILLLFNKLDLGELLPMPSKPKGRCTVDSPDLMVNINKLDIMVDLIRMFNLPTPRLRLVIPKMMIRP
jgi:zinc finger protein CreA/MIG